jgi:uncharacterized membrane protein
MNDKDDPFLGVVRVLDKKTQAPPAAEKRQDEYLDVVMGFILGTDPKARELGRRLEKAVDNLQANIIMSTFLLMACVLILLLASPLLILSESSLMRNVGALMHVSAGLLMLCHQLPYRSFIIDGVPMAVCARDVGIYLGSLLGFATVLMADRPKILSSLKIVVLATIPIALDGVTQTILLLRESNNVLRLATGLIFGFGMWAYLANRWLSRWYPLFRHQVIGTRLVIADALVVIIVLYVFLSGAGQEIEKDYMGPSEAIQTATSLSSIPDPVEIRAYYISSLSPLSSLDDPYYERHRDMILDDIHTSNFTILRERIFKGEVENPYPTGNFTTSELLDQISKKEHKLGIWAVTVLSEKSTQGDAPYLSQGRGEYFYFDAYSGKPIMRTTH